jgi:hypothetical protein
MIQSISDLVLDCFELQVRGEYAEVRWFSSSFGGKEEEGEGGGGFQTD